jgi:myo-inositol-1(or 4)-monophosphatase
LPGGEPNDLQLLLSIVREAGIMAMEKFRKHPKSWHKPDGTIVTETDIAVDKYLRATISKARPDDGWLSEETSDDGSRLQRARFWIADPIDGTRLYLAGENGWGIGVALIEGGDVQLSALLLPSQEKLFHAIRGEGAFLNGGRISLQGSGSASVIAPRSFAGPLGEAGFQFQPGSHLPLLLRFAAIAEGHLAGAITLGEKNDWDIAAGHLILTEAGGVVSTGQGDSIVYNRKEAWQPGVIAAGPQWHGALVDLVRHH